MTLSSFASVLQCCNVENVAMLKCWRYWRWRKCCNVEILKMFFSSSSLCQSQSHGCNQQAAISSLVKANDISISSWSLLIHQCWITNVDLMQCWINNVDAIGNTPYTDRFYIEGCHLMQSMNNHCHRWNKNSVGRFFFLRNNNARLSPTSSSQKSLVASASPKQAPR